MGVTSVPVTLNRRRFLGTTFSVMLSVGLAQYPKRGAAGSSADAPAPTRDAWQDLAGALQGPVLLPGQAGFARLAQPWNLRYAAILPAGIARCVSGEDVRTCLLWAQANDMPLVARSGGHSYAGYSTTTGLMTDLSLMNQVDYDAGSGLARVGGGARNGDVYAAFRTIGRAITHGRCERVGVAGLTLGGGIGFNQRRHGLTCDQLVEAEVVTASGERVRCNERENADLFWACRGGGGGNFGITTSLTFQTFPVDMVTVFRLIWTTNLDSLLPAALDLLPTVTDRLGCKLSVISDGSGLSMELLGQLVGSADELRALLAPLDRLAAPDQETVQTVPYWDGQDFLSEEGEPQYSHERSRYIVQPVPADGSRTILDFMRRWPGTRAEADWKMFLAGGAVAAVPAGATAFVHRTALMISSIELVWTAGDTVGTVARNQEWLAEFHDAMRPFASEGCYQNFIDEAQPDFLRAYYGDNLARLIEVKRRYDPTNLFRFPQSIPLA
jgi:FAD/FMN-containing dehydrogenase